VADLVAYAVSAGVAHLELNRPESANALDVPLARALLQAVQRAGADDGVRALLVTGAGPRFCAGGDVASFVAAEDRAAHLHLLATEADAAVRALSELAKPVVAAVHGAVAGAGLAVMLGCDLVIADPGTKFVFAYPGIGLTPDCGLSYLLPRVIGQQRALGFALGGDPLTAADALDWGLVTDVAQEPNVRARDLAEAIASGPARALGETRRLLRDGWRLGRDAVGAEEARTISEMVRGPEAQELIDRFVNR
jgi:2-(1,2-epoxy-1,2-dihydrophenyl)acetyl-CoA isomerase